MKPWTRLPHDHDARWLAFVVGAVVVLLALQFWLWGRVHDSASQFRDRQTQQQQLSNVQELTEDIRRVDGGQQALLEQAAAAYPLPAAVPLVVERVEGLAEAQGLVFNLDSIGQPRATREKRGLTSFDLIMTAVGPPHALLAFLDAVEHMQEFTRVESWEMSVLPGAAPAGKTYIMHMTLRFFLQ